jgi:acyl carrier protein
MDKIFDILEELHPEFDYRTSEDYLSDGMLDSFDIISLVTSLEDTYGIIIDALDILPENFCSAAAIAGVVRKNGGAV